MINQLLIEKDKNLKPNRHIRTLILLGIALMTTAACTAPSQIQRISTNPDLEQSANIVELTIDINASLDDTWNLVGTNFDKNKLFNNNADSTFYLDKPVEMIGAQRRTQVGKNKFLDVEVTEFDEANHYVAWEIISTNVAPMKVAFSSYKVIEIENDRVRVSQRSGFKLNNPIMDVVGKLRFHKLFVDELATLKYVLETRNAKTSLPKKQRVKEYYPAVNMKKYY